MCGYKPPTHGADLNFRMSRYLTPVISWDNAAIAQTAAGDDSA
jgi:hypothetical protein